MTDLKPAGDIISLKINEVQAGAGIRASVAPPIRIQQGRSGQPASPGGASGLNMSKHKYRTVTTRHPLTRIGARLLLSVVAACAVLVLKAPAAHAATPVQAAIVANTH